MATLGEPPQCRCHLGAGRSTNAGGHCSARSSGLVPGPPSFLVCDQDKTGRCLVAPRRASVLQA